MGQGTPTPVGTSGYGGGHSFLLALATAGEERVDSVRQAFAHRGVSGVTHQVGHGLMMETGAQLRSWGEQGVSRGPGWGTMKVRTRVSSVSMRLA